MLRKVRLPASEAPCIERSRLPLSFASRLATSVPSLAVRASASAASMPGASATPSPSTSALQLLSEKPRALRRAPSTRRVPRPAYSLVIASSVTS